MFKIGIFLLSMAISSSLVAKQQSLERLLEGNARYMKDALLHPEHTRARREALLIKQEPFAIIVGCSDSRVSPEIIFDQGIGDIFVVRVAGNVIGPLELNSIEYAVLYLHASVIFVLGHENCGAVQAVIQGVTQDIPAVAALIEPAVQEAKATDPAHLLEASVKTNALRMREYLLTIPTIQQLVADKKIEVHAGYYHLQTGAVEVLSQ